MPRAILALDQGTTSSRAILFDEEGGIISVAQREFEQIFPSPGLVEHDPNEIWESQKDVALEAIKESGLSPSDIAGIGITNQRETVVVWDRKTGEPIGNAIVWQDRRTADFCKELEGETKAIQTVTGLVVDAYFSGTKIRWITSRAHGSVPKLENSPSGRSTPG
jgi:glycerol kinase